MSYLYIHVFFVHFILIRFLREGRRLKSQGWLITSTRWVNSSSYLKMVQVGRGRKREKAERVSKKEKESVRGREKPGKNMQSSCESVFILLLLLAHNGEKMGKIDIESY